MKSLIITAIAMLMNMGTIHAEQGSVEERDLEWLNAVSSSQLQKIKGIGPKMAERIIEARTKKPFKTYADYDAVKGIGPVLMDETKRYLEEIDPD